MPLSAVCFVADTYTLDEEVVVAQEFARWLERAGFREHRVSVRRDPRFVGRRPLLLIEGGMETPRSAAGNTLPEAPVS